MRKTIANKGQRPSLLTGRTVRRIARAVTAFERGDRDIPGRRFRRFGGGEDDPPTRLGKTTAEWVKGSIATVALYEEGAAGSEAESGELEGCVNKYLNVPADRWVTVARAGNDVWYLIAAEC